MSAWDPNKYLRFGDERTRPAFELAGRVAVESPATVIDLGCGPGNSTQVVRRRWPAARVCGLDSSPEMIAAAHKAYPDQEWMAGRIEEWAASEPYDVVFSNAALHWIPNHTALTQHLFAQVAAGGAFAFQIPSGAESPFRTAIQDVSEDAAWTDRMDAARNALTMEPPEVYYDALATQARALDIWETIYQHVMESPAAIVEWISSTSLRPFLNALASDQERQRFVALVTERVTKSYPTRTNGRVLFPFQRMFVIAYR